MDRTTLSYGQLAEKHIQWPDWVSYIVVQCNGELMGFEYEPVCRLPAGPCPAYWDRRNGTGNYFVLDRSMTWETKDFNKICLHVGKSVRAEAEKKRKAFLNGCVGKVFTDARGSNAVCTYINMTDELVMAGRGYTLNQLAADGWHSDAVPLDVSTLASLELPPAPEKPQ